MGASEAKEIVLDATLENLDAVNGFIEESLAPLECVQEKRIQLDVAVEEIFVNIVNYAYPSGQGLATVQAETMANPLGIRIAFIDEGKPYNPLLGEEPNLAHHLKERKVGGLGLLFVKKNVDSIDYEYRDGKNILTLWKKLS